MSQSDADHVAVVIPNDGLNRRLPYVPRLELVDDIIAKARDNQAVVVGAPPAMGKTALLQEVKWKLEGLEDGQLKVHRKRITGKESLMDWLKKKGISEDEDENADLVETWLLFDDAQNAYEEEFHPFWEHLIKGVKTSDLTIDKVFIVIAATYDLSTPTSPVVFTNLPHPAPNFSLNETNRVVDIYARPLGVAEWNLFLGNLRTLARLPDGRYHIGVVVAGFFLVQGLKKAAHQQDHFSEDYVTDMLRSPRFSTHLQRCYGLRLDDNGVHQSSYDIAEVLLGQNTSVPPQLVRGGILQSNGQFTSMAGWWYYNRVCFPNRALQAPNSLDELVVEAVKLLSAKRMYDGHTTDGIFPKEATFQHLFNEALSMLLPLQNYLVPEFSTFALDEDGDPVHGELDFYINGNLQWCLELLRNGDKIGEHLDRFDDWEGKYRNVMQRSFLVVDCRGPKKKAVKPDEARCTLYFEDDFSSCICKMRLEPEFPIQLKP